jgi:hypothetical protein
LFISGPPCSGSIGNYEPYNHSVYPVYHLWLQTPSFPERASAHPEGLVSLVENLVEVKLFLSLTKDRLIGL